MSVLTCDLVALPPVWEASRGAQREVQAVERELRGGQGGGREVRSTTVVGMIGVR